MVLICEYRGIIPHPVVSPSPHRSVSAVSGALLAFPASRFTPRPSDTIGGTERVGGAAGRLAACSAGRWTGRAVSSELSCVRAAACHACLRSLTAVPLSASPPLARSRMMSPHDALARPFPSCPPFYIAPPIDTRDGERGGGASACSAVRMG